MQNNQKDIIDALNWRYAVKVFDPSKNLDTDLLNTILESGRLSPSSLGMEPWKFFVIENKDIRQRLFEASKQPKVLDASHLIVITYRTDGDNLVTENLERTAKIQQKTIESLEGYKNMLEGTVSQARENGKLESWLKAQSYIPLGIMIETAALLGVDAGPMEGFNADTVDEILDLKNKNLKSTSMLALGYRGEDPAAVRPKVRREFKEVVEFI